MKNTRQISPTLAERLLSPFQEFLYQEASAGILLLIFTAVALVWANSPWVDVYNNLWHGKLTIGYENFGLSKPLELWINDGLMAVFFFVVGLEIKREVLTGELASFRKAILPIMAAIGGMLVPALIYNLFNFNGDGRSGWGIPMATDIAFALGILALLGKRVPVALKVFLTAVAIVDDLGAVLVIALFYTAEISWLSLTMAGVFFIILLAINWLGVRHPLMYALFGFGLWLALLNSGVHAAIAGVLVAMTIPSGVRINIREFTANSRAILDHLEKANDDGETVNDAQRAALQALEETVEYVESPLQRLEHALHPWVAFFIMPVFALANAGVSFGGQLFSALSDPISLGIMAGLVVGKQVGITAFSWLAVKSKLADLPAGTTWRQIYGVSWLAGIGFTMSLFVATLAFGATPSLATAKIGILAASFIAGVVGLIILRTASQAQAD